MSRSKRRRKRQKPRAKTKQPSPRQPLISAIEPHEVAKGLIKEMKAAEDNSERIRLLEGISGNAMALAWIAILYKEEDEVRLRAVDLIGSDFAALKEVHWRAGDSKENMKTGSAVTKKLDGLLDLTEDPKVLAISASHSEDPDVRSSAAMRLIGKKDHREIVGGATYSHFEDTRDMFLGELIRGGDIHGIVSVAMFCRHPETSRKAIDALAGADSFEFLMEVYRDANLRESRVYAIEKALKSGVGKVLANHEKHGDGVWVLFRKSEPILTSLEHARSGFPIHRNNLLDHQALRIAALAFAVLQDNSWDPHHSGNPALRTKRLLYRLFRLSAPHERNTRLRGVLGLNSDQTADLEWKPQCGYKTRSPENPEIRA